MYFLIPKNICSRNHHLKVGITKFIILQVLNHHIQRVNEAEQERVAAEEVHRSISERMTQLSKEIAQMLEGNARSIKKSRHYFEQRIEFTRVLEHQKSLILKLESEVGYNIFFSGFLSAKCFGYYYEEI